MEFLRKNGDIYLSCKDFNLDETLDCGQAFRWERNSNGGYFGYKMNFPLEIYPEKDYFVLKNTSEEDFLSVWYDYFDFDTDYSELKRKFSEDETLSKACEFAGGIRLLRQDSFEALFSFIISQNNNIPRIKKIIGTLCDAFGGFPTADELSGKTAEDLDFLRAGFRAKYLADCVLKINSNEISLDTIKNSDVNFGRTELMKIKGVGPKVAECALLYGMYKTECFPIDVWIKRVLEEFYPNGFPEYLFADAGIAQQFLFHYVRNLEK